MFAAGACTSLITGGALVRRLERVAGKAQLSDALLGALAAMAADSPEITSAVTAIAHGQTDVGAGVVLGSAVFNLSALMGLGAVVARGLPLGRRVIAFAGAVTTVLTVLALLTVGPRVNPGLTLALAVAVLGAYLLLLGAPPSALAPLRRFRVCARPVGWLMQAVAEEELAEEEEFEPERRSPQAARAPVWRDLALAGMSLLVVVGASYAMERSVTSLGSRVGAPGIVIGALVLGAVTGIPNAVASIYLARKGNGTGALSAALNSNNFNIVIGLLVPAVIAGTGTSAGGEVLVASWCLALTAICLTVGWRSGRLGRGFGSAVLVAYGAFAGAVVATGLS